MFKEESRPFPANIDINVRPKHLLTRAEEISLSNLVQSGSCDAEKKLFESNIKLVYHFVNKYKGNGLEVEDLLQEGYISLLKSVRGFDPSFGVRFSTYSSQIIRNDLASALSSLSRLVRMPHEAYREFMELRNRVDELTKDNFEPPKILEINKLTGVPVRKIKRLYNAVKLPLSLDTDDYPNKSNQNIKLSEILPDPGQKDPLEEVILHNLQGDIEFLLTTLPSREALIIQHRFGLNGFDPKTVREVAKVMGTSKSNVFLLEKQALARLCQFSDRVDLDEYLTA